MGKIAIFLSLVLMAGCKADELIVRPSNEVHVEVARATTVTWHGQPKWALKDISLTPLPLNSSTGETISWDVTKVDYIHPNKNLEINSAHNGWPNTYPVRIKFLLVWDDRLLGQKLSFRFKGTLLTVHWTGTYIPHPVGCDEAHFFLMAFWRRSGHTPRKTDPIQKQPAVYPVGVRQAGQPAC
jgi:hypothetical protein